MGGGVVFQTSPGPSPSRARPARALPFLAIPPGRRTRSAASKEHRDCAEKRGGTVPSRYGPGVSPSDSSTGRKNAPPRR